MTVTWGSTRVDPEGEGAGKLHKRLDCGFHGKERLRQGEHARDGAPLNHFSRLREKGAVPSHLVPSDGYSWVQSV